MRRVPPIAGRAGWALVDQGLSSATNLGASLLAARWAGVDALGQYGICLATYLVVLGISRALSTDPLLIRFSAADGGDRQLAIRRAVGSAFVVGVIAGLACVAAALVINGRLRDALLALGILMPGLLVQDAWRFAGFCSGRPQAAALNDAVWAISQIAITAFVLSRGDVTAALVVCSWAIGAAVAAAAGCIQFRGTPLAADSTTWWKDHGDLGGRFALEHLGVTGGTQLTTYGLALFAGVAAVGSLRAAQVLFGPMNVLFLGASAITLPEAARLRQRGDGRLRSLLIAFSLVLAFGALFVGAALMAMPSHIGRALLGSSWDAGRPLLLPMTINLAAAGGIAGASLGLRAFEAAGKTLRTRMSMMPVMAACGLAGAAWFGAAGAAWGLAIANTVAVVPWWAYLARDLRVQRAPLLASASA
jgi:O-antigen/teichoic acid export membrane protein